MPLLVAIEGGTLVGIVVPIVGLVAIWLNQRGEFKKAEIARQNAKEDAIATAEHLKREALAAAENLKHDALEVAEKLEKKVDADAEKKDEQLKQITILVDGRLSSALEEISALKETIAALKETIAALLPPDRDKLQAAVDAAKVADAKAVDANEAPITGLTDTAKKEGTEP